MRKLSAFLSLSLDGCFADAAGGVDWAHSDDPEFQRFVADNARGGGALLMGRVTYEMMAAWWPSEAARQMSPVVAEGMNRMPKYLVSHRPRNPEWAHTVQLAGALPEAVRALKGEAGPDIAILGSGSLVSQLAGAGLIDEFQFVVCPLVLAGGRKVFEGLEDALALQLTESRSFASGQVFLRYRPA
ncbi:dihydrofolate reductase family protein [Niveibacterium sp. SC-1]|uniref:dihydrofolate reductase family protein n=1 Tax=Niveibacterium sp. SC-1 TaxID=3135646 RepID=UPI00311DF683